MTYKNTSIYLLLLLLLLVSSGNAFAAPDFADMGSLEQGFLTFVTTVDNAVTGVINSAAIQTKVDLLWTFFAVFLLIWTVVLWMFGKGQLIDVITVVLLIMFVRVIMNTFDNLTDGIWQAVNGYAGDVQNGLIGTPDLFFAPSFISRAFSSITFSNSGLGLVSGIAAAINVAIYSVVALILSGLAYFAVIWSFWGYSIAKLIGLLFMPFLMYERLSWLFDGWLRFFFGFVLYALIARLNIALLALAIASYFGIGVTPGDLYPVSQPPLTSLSHIFSLLIFCLVGILATLSTGSFVQTLVGGNAQSTGVGSMISRSASRVAAALVTK